MGFEQLAELKKQLAQRNNEAKASQRSQRPRPATAGGAQAKPQPKAQAKPQAKPQTKPVDPVVRTIGRLQNRFPKAFPKNPAPKVPLKVGIFADLVSHAAALKLTEAELQEAIKIWCRGARYWASIVEDAPRLDLEGQEVGKVTATEAAGARRMSTKRPPKGPRAQAAQTAPAANAEAAESAAQVASETVSETTATEPVAPAADTAAE